MYICTFHSCSLCNPSLCAILIIYFYTTHHVCMAAMCTISFMSESVLVLLAKYAKYKECVSNKKNSIINIKLNRNRIKEEKNKIKSRIFLQFW